MKKASLIIVVLFFSIYWTVVYQLAEKQYEAFDSVMKFDSEEMVLKALGEPDDLLSAGYYMYWGEEDTSVEQDGTIEYSLAFDTKDYWFHPQSYVIGFDGNGKVVSKVVFRIEKQYYPTKRIGKWLGLNPS